MRRTSLLVTILAAASVIVQAAEPAIGKLGAELEAKTVYLNPEYLIYSLSK